jgi:DTW domain-containing protein YfiP
MQKKIKFTLLTHEREFGKRSNTGQLVLDVLGDAAEQVRWDRANPPEHLVDEIAAGCVALIYPGASDEAGGDFTDIERFIIIDGTWIEARKIYQRSPYLREVRRFSLKTEEKSAYNLRKNQKTSGLCTAECVIEVLRNTGNHAAAERLQEGFLAFIRPPEVIRGEVQGH